MEDGVTNKLVTAGSVFVLALSLCLSWTLLGQKDRGSYIVGQTFDEAGGRQDHIE